MHRTRAWLPFAACVALAAACSCSPAPADTKPPDACANGVKDEAETDVDCGGACPACADGKACGGAADCASGVCDGGVCAAPSCNDGVRNGDETGVDCGGATCFGCGSGLRCTTGSECASGVCLHGSCDCGDAEAVFVSASTGDDANPGTAAAPLRTIQAAVACAYEIPREIRVAGGVYQGNRANAIGLVEGKSLVGGWSDDFLSRSPTAHPSEIRDTTDTGGPFPAPFYVGVAVYISSTSTATALDGFTIQGATAGAGNVTAIAIAAPPGQRAGGTIKNDVVHCGGGAEIGFARCVDLGTSGGSIVVEGDTFHLGTSRYTSWGIQGYAVQDVEIRGNLFDDGSSGTVIPIELWVGPSWSPLVEANDVLLGAGGASGVRVALQDSMDTATPAIRNNVVVVTGDATGIEDASAAEISNNTVIAAAGTAIRTGVPGARIRNNAIVTGASGTCLEEANATADPSSVHDNDLYGCGVLYLDEHSTPLLLAEVNAALPPALANISADPTLDAANGYRPLANSPLLGAGEDLSSLFQTDKAGAPRAEGWTIGAYQNPTTP